MGVSRDVRDRIEIRPPVRSGDLEQLWGESTRRPIVILDGLFNSEEAITPRECRATLRRGFSLVGAASMGALRAADLWPVGMLGLGEVYAGFRTGLLRSDADVAVNVDPKDFTEVTLSMVFVRAALSSLIREGLTSVAEARIALNRVRAIYFGERYPDVVRSSLLLESGLSQEAIAGFCDFVADATKNPKVKDGSITLQAVLGRVWMQDCARGHEGEREPVHTGSRDTCPICRAALGTTDMFCAVCCSDAHEQSGG